MIRLEVSRQMNIGECRRWMAALLQVYKERFEQDDREQAMFISDWRFDLAVWYGTTKMANEEARKAKAL